MVAHCRSKIRFVGGRCRSILRCVVRTC
ncbi:MAG TPA: hypothetical protein DCP91_02820 [Eggerthellaceae bacterium]|nr:hypothetical protein [Eggerthellaceae bacterium]